MISADSATAPRSTAFVAHIRFGKAELEQPAQTDRQTGQPADVLPCASESDRTNRWRGWGTGGGIVWVVGNSIT